VLVVTLTKLVVAATADNDDGDDHYHHNHYWRSKIILQVDPRLVRRTKYDAGF